MTDEQYEQAKENHRKWMMISEVIQILIKDFRIEYQPAIDKLVAERRRLNGHKDAY